MTESSGERNRAFMRLYEPVHRDAAAFCTFLAGSRLEGEDLLADSLVSALRRFGQLRDPARFKSWLFAVARNEFRARLRKRRAHRYELLDADVGEKTSAPERQDGAEEVLPTLACLPQDYREVIILFHLEEMPMAEVARVLGIRENTARVRLHRARKMLARLLGFPESTKLSTYREESLCLKEVQSD